MTLRTLRSIIREAGLAHAEFCIEQAAHSMPRARVDRLYRELEKARAAAGNA